MQSKNINHYNEVTKALTICLCGLLGIVGLSAAVLSSTKVNADETYSVVDSVATSIPAACTMNGSGMNSHNATLSPGTYSASSGSPYENGIGSTTITAFCNDPEGFAIYAIGYTNDTLGNTNLIGTLSSHPTIATGTATTGNVSSWSMKVDKVTDSTAYMPAYMYIDNSFNTSYKAVPSTYTKVAHYQATAGTPSTTDTTLGAKVTTTYAAYVAPAQIADSYSGQVKYIMVHPNSFVAGTYTVAYNANGGSGTMTSETGLLNYAEHTLKTNTFTAPSGYQFAGWCTVQDSGANPQTTCSGTSYADEGTVPPSTVGNGGTLTLYAYWSLITYMQDVATWGSALSAGDEVITTDARDNKQYYVAKLADGNIWMTQNLDHDISSSYNYTSENTDVSSTVTGLTSTYATVTTNWNWSKTAPESYDPGDRCWNGAISTTSSIIDTGTVSCSSLTTEPNHYHIGNYYNWTAAVAMTNSSSYTADNTDVNQSICPSGWRLPIGGTSSTGSKSFQYLVNQLSLTSGTSGNIQNTPVYFVYGGSWSGYSSYVGSRGLYWSSVVYNSNSSYQLDFNANGTLNLQSRYNRDYGRSVRCAAR